MFEGLIDELRELETPDLVARLEAAELARRSAVAEIAAVTSVVTERASYQDHGYRSARSFLKGTLNCSGATANKIRKRAALTKAHSDVGDALVAGHIGVDQADRLATAHSHRRAGGRFDEFKPSLLDHAEHLQFDDFDKTVERFVQFADPDGSFDDQQYREEHRNASVRDDSGSVCIWASGGDPQTAAEMKRIHELAMEVEFDKDCAAQRAEFGDDAPNHELPRTASQRSFDALHEIFLGWAAVPADAKTPEPLVNVILDHVSAGHALVGHGLVSDPNVLDLPADVFAAAEADVTNRRCETSTGTAVHSDVALQALIAGRVRRVVVDADGVIVNLGRSRRLFTGKVRDAAQLLVRSCSHPGCDIPAEFCDVDHLDEWVRDGGETNQANAGPSCGSHNRWKHANQIRARRAANGRVFLINPDGTTILPIGAREPDWAESSPPPTERAS